MAIHIKKSKKSLTTNNYNVLNNVGISNSINNPVQKLSA